MPGKMRGHVIENMRFILFIPLVKNDFETKVANEITHFGVRESENLAGLDF